MEQIRTEILVVGGGPAGVCAALAAARQGRQVLLAGNRPVLGGNSSSEIRVWMRGATGAGNLFSEEMGILGELKLRNYYVNPDGNPIFWDDVQLDAMLREKNITLLLNTEVYALDCEDGMIKNVYAVQSGTEKQYEIQFQALIDCTGDGTMSYYAGVPYYIGDTRYDGLGREEHPAKTHGGIMGNTILYYVRKADHAVPFVAPEYAYDMKRVEALIGKGGRIVDEKQSGSDYWWFEYGGMGDTIGDHQEIGIELRRLVMGVWNYIKNSGKFDASNLTLEWIGSFPGKRESRRMEAAHVLNKQELLSHKKFEDGAFYGGWYIDDHPSEGFLTEEENCVQLPVNLYEIPFSTLYHPAVKNLFFAGRVIGVTREVFFSSRVMNTCALSGQAAGTLAATCLEQGGFDQGVTAQAVQKARCTLQKDDMLLFDWVNEPGEVAQEGSVYASSSFRGEVPHNGSWLPVNEKTFLTIPSSAGEMLLLKIKADQPGVLKGEFYHSPIPSRYCPGNQVGSTSIVVKAGQTQVMIPFPYQRDGFITWELEPSDGISIGLSSCAIPGVLMGYRSSPVYHTPAIELPDIYRGNHVVGPYNRPYQNPNAWVPGLEDPAPQLELHWKAPKHLNEIRVYFDPELSMELPSTRTEHIAPSHLFAGRSGMPGQLVKSYTLWVYADGTWSVVGQSQKNWRRMVTVPISPQLKVERVRLQVHKTWGKGPAAVYGLRAYEVE